MPAAIGNQMVKGVDKKAETGDGEHDDGESVVDGAFVTDLLPGENGCPRNAKDCSECVKCREVKVPHPDLRDRISGPVTVALADVRAVSFYGAVIRGAGGEYNYRIIV